MVEPVRRPAARVLPASRVGYREVSDAEAVAAGRLWWDADADTYLGEHGTDIGDVAFLWCPEGLTEQDAGLLGEVRGARVLEVGCGSAPCARWLATKGAEVVALDLSAGMLAHAVAAGERTGLPVPLVQAHAGRLPLPDGSFDIVCSAFGAVVFVADSAAVMAEVARVLRPGGRWVFSVTHPCVGSFPTTPARPAWKVQRSYFDRLPYVEDDASGRATYVEQHRTMGDRVREIVAAGLRLVDVLEPEWTPGRTREWGQWSPCGALMPGTAIFVCERPVDV